MAFNLSALAGQTVPAEIVFMGQTAKITYDPTVITTETLTKADQSDTEFFGLFCDLVKTWDVTKAGKKVPITPKTLNDMPLVFLRAVFRAVLNDTQESAGEAVSNSNGG